MLETQKFAPLPFTILVDSAEQQPFHFTNIKSSKKYNSLPYLIEFGNGMEWRPLGRHPNGLGDYSILGLHGVVNAERKSLKDLQGTLLGWGGRRERFEQELENLSSIKYGAIVVEATFGDVIKLAPETTHKTARENGKTLFGTILSFQSKYTVPWYFCDNRRFAEVTTFRFLERGWLKEKEASRNT